MEFAELYGFINTGGLIAFLLYQYWRDQKKDEEREKAWEEKMATSDENWAKRLTLIEERHEGEIKRAHDERRANDIQHKQEMNRMNEILRAMNERTLDALNRNTASNEKLSESNNRLTEAINRIMFKEA